MVLAVEVGDAVAEPEDRDDAARRAAATDAQATCAFQAAEPRHAVVVGTQEPRDGDEGRVLEGVLELREAGC